jgi:hypothetical protein
MFLFSCKKEEDFGNNSGGTNPTRLVKMVTKLGSDSSVYNFSYNSSGKITGVILSGAESGQPIDLRISYVRNASGIIQKQVLKSNEFAAVGIDSIVTIVNYDAGNNRYKNAVSAFSVFGFPIRDSIVFQYDASGKMIAEIDYTDGGGGYDPSTKTEYSYSGNNVLSEKFYSYTGAAFDLDETDTYEYDAKTNPLQFASDAVVLNLVPFYSANNITKTTVVASNPADNYITTETYTYNSSNRPATSTSVTGSETATTTYYYQ